MVTKETKKKKPSLLQRKIEKIRTALDALGITIPDDVRPMIDELVKLCEIKKDLVKELKLHPGTYAYMAEQSAVLSMEIEYKEQETSTRKASIDDACNVTIAILREDNIKLTVDQKKEVVSMLQQGTFLDSGHYHEISDEEKAKQANGLAKGISEMTDEQEKLQYELLDLKAKKSFVDQIVSALAYQKNMSLRSLVELQTTGINQEIG